MDIDPVVIPVDFRWLEWMTGRIDRSQRPIKLPDVAAVEGVGEFLNVWTINLDQRTGQFGTLSDANHALV